MQLNNGSKYSLSKVIPIYMILYNITVTNDTHVKLESVFDIGPNGYAYKLLYSKRK